MLAISIVSSVLAWFILWFNACMMQTLCRACMIGHIYSIPFCKARMQAATAGATKFIIMSYYVQFMYSDTPKSLGRKKQTKQIHLHSTAVCSYKNNTLEFTSVWDLERINPWTAGVSGWISDCYCIIKPLWSGMGEVVPARTSLTLHPPSPPTVPSLSCLNVSQCINCRD